MNGITRHYVARLEACLRNPQVLVVLVSFAAMSFAYWPYLTVISEIGKNPYDADIMFYQFLWLWPAIPAICIKGRAVTGGKYIESLSGQAMPALPVGPKARVIAETLVALTFLLAVRMIGSLFFGWGDLSGFFAGLALMLPFMLAFSNPSANVQWYMLRPLLLLAALLAAIELNLLDGIISVLGMGVLLCAAAIALIGRDLNNLVLLKDRYRSPSSHFRPALEPEARLRRDAWALVLSRYGVYLAITAIVEGSVLVLDRVIGLQDFVVEFCTMMTATILLFIFGLRPFGSGMIPEKLIQMEGRALGDFLRAFSILPTRREAVLRLAFAHSFVATALAAVFVFAVVGYYGMENTGEFAIVDERGQPVFWKLFPLITAMLVIPAAVVAGAAGDKLKGSLCLGYSFVVAPLTIVLGGELKGAANGELLVMAIVAIAALAVGLPPLKYLKANRDPV